MSTFRDSVFQVAKSLVGDPLSLEIRRALNTIGSVNSEETQLEDNIMDNDINLFWSYVERLHLQFYGILLVDEIKESIKTGLESNNGIKIFGLSKNKRALCEKGHLLLMLFINLCLEDIKGVSPLLAELINPYSGNKSISIQERISNQVDIINLFIPAIESFKCSEVYKTVLSSNCQNVLEEANRDASITVIVAYKKEIENSYLHGQTEVIRNVINSLNHPYTSIKDIMEAYLVLVSSLRLSLQLACQTFFNSIMGENLLVFNHDNIISIQEIKENGMGTRFKVTVQGVSWKKSNQELTSLLLINCDSSSTGELHDFGMILGKTSTFASEFGETSKFTFVRANHDLDIIENLTKLIVEKGLPTLTKDITK